ncbi:diguanylate cyclase domain-containing protein [Ramlibacter sp.]|uniref:diguanylate cyclase domain-containing protein n=1 Tax=Ramlibacter sp. TaxID=1917967 RepID=UPI003D0C0524
MNPAFEPTRHLDDNAAPPQAGPMLRRAGRWLRALAAVAALAALALALGAAMSASLADAEDALACAALALIALHFSGRAQRRVIAEHGGLDGSTGLYNRRGLVIAGDEAVARGKARPASLVVLDLSDLVEVPAIYGREIGHRVVKRVVERVQALAGPNGLAARTGKAQFTVMLPGTDLDKAVERVHHVLGRPGRIEFEAGHTEIILVPVVQVEALAAGQESVADLLGRMERLVASHIAQEQRRRAWLKRERERHSRPSPLGA